MSRKSNRHIAQEKLPVVPVAVTLSAEPKAEIVVDQSQQIEWFRRCPICWGRCKGVGLAYSKNGSTRYYKCSRTLTEEAPCGHTWTAIVRSEVIRVDHRIVTLETR